MVDNISSQDAENARLRSEYLKDSNKAMEYSRDLAKEMASFVKEEFLYQEGIIEDKRTSKDLGDQIAKQAKVANAAQKQAMVEFKKGNKDEGVKLSLLAKQAKKRIENLKGVQSEIKENSVLLDVIKKQSEGMSKKALQTKAFAFASKQAGSLFGILKNVILEASKISAGLQQNVNMSDKEASSLMKHFEVVADNAGKAGINSISLNKAFQGLNAELGTASKFIRDDIVKETVELTKFMGMSSKQAASFAQFSLISGKNMNNVTQEVIKGQISAQKEKGIRMSVRDVMAKTAAVTGQIRAQLGANPAAIAKAVVLAKQFGMELSQVAKSGEALLNFEQSISKELEAELLTGKQLNLEQARLAALTGDYETLTRELNKNIGTYSDFMGMNVLQQRAMAQAFGMSVDELSEMLIAERSLEELAAEARAAGQEDRAIELEEQAKKRDLAQQFADIQERVTGILVANMGSVIKLVEFFAGLANHAGIIKGVLVAIGAIKFTGLLVQIGTMVASLTASAAAATATSSALTMGLGMAAVLAGVAIVMGGLIKYGVGLAQGGIVMPRAGGTPAIIGEGGRPEAVIPLHRAGEMGFGGGEIDYDKMAEAMAKAKIAVEVSTVSNSFDAKNSQAGEGEYASDVKYDIPFA